MKVKPCIRKHKAGKRAISEAAQLAAWISQFPADYDKYRKEAST